MIAGAVWRGYSGPPNLAQVSVKVCAQCSKFRVEKQEGNMPTDEFVYHRSKNYGKVPEPLLHDATASDGAIRLYAHIQWRSGQAHKSFESQETMATMLGVSEKTVKKRIAELEQRDWVVTRVHNYNKKTKKRATNIYHIFEVQTDCKQFREDHKDSLFQPKSDEPIERKSRKGIGGKPTHHPNSSTGSSDVNGTGTNTDATRTQVPMNTRTQVPGDPVLKDYPVQKKKDSSTAVAAKAPPPKKTEQISFSKYAPPIGPSPNPHALKDAFIESYPDMADAYGRVWDIVHQLNGSSPAAR